MTGVCTGLTAPQWPKVLAVTIKLLFPAVDGQRLERAFHADFINPVDAYNVACCMWSTKHTGYGAIAAVIIDEATGEQYHVTQAENTCGQYPAAAMERVASTARDVIVAATRRRVGV